MAFRLITFQTFRTPLPFWVRMTAGTFKGKLDQDRVTRASLLVSLYEGLRLLFNRPLNYGWPKTANSGAGFGGHSPADVMKA